MIKRTLMSLLLLAAASNTLADQHNSECREPLSPADQKRQVIRSNLWGAGIITAWGTISWDYFQNSPIAQNEGWFGNDTGSGGADKMGHLYSGYVTTKALAHYYETKCFPDADAARYASLSTFVLAGLIEAGDSFSKHGWSTNDFLIGSLGSLIGYAMLRNPELDRRVDLRVGFGTNPQSSDISTDYDNMKYLMALKLNGFDATRKPILEHLELHAGYYTRGFDNDDPKERNLYVGVGVNLSDFLRSRGYRRTATALNYIQLPGTSVESTYDLND